MSDEISANKLRDTAGTVRALVQNAMASRGLMKVANQLEAAADRIESMGGDDDATDYEAATIVAPRGKTVTAPEGWELGDVTPSTRYVDDGETIADERKVYEWTFVKRSEADE